MPPRFPPRPSGDANSPLDELEVEVVRTLGNQSSKSEYKDKDGATDRPICSVRLHPNFFQPFSIFGNAILTQKDFPPTERELIVLAVTAVYDLPYVPYARARLALSLGMTKEQVASASKGAVPTGTRRVYYT